MKKSQVTLFLIIGIILVLFTLIYFGVPFANQDENQATSSDTFDPVTVYVNNCLSDTAQEGIYRLALYGGYLYPSGIAQYQEPGDGAHFQDYFYQDSLKYPFQVNGETYTLRSMETIQEVLAQYIAVELPLCIDEFLPLENIGYQMSAEQLLSSHITPMVDGEQVTIQLDWPVIAVNGGESQDLEQFSVSLPLRFGKVYEIGKNLIQHMVNAGSRFSLHTRCSSYVEENINIYVDHDPKQIASLIRIVDAGPLQQGKLPLRYQFAVKNKEVLGQCAN